MESLLRNSILAILPGQLPDDEGLVPGGGAGCDGVQEEAAGGGVHQPRGPPRRCLGGGGPRPPNKGGRCVEGGRGTRSKICAFCSWAHCKETNRPADYRDGGTAVWYGLQ